MAGAYRDVRDGSTRPRAGSAHGFALRAEAPTSHLPIIMVTARAEETDRIVGLDIGAGVLSRDLLLGDVWGYRYTGGTRNG